MFAKIFKQVVSAENQFDFQSNLVFVTDRIVDYEYTKRWTKTGDFKLVFPFRKELLRAVKLNGFIYFDDDWLWIQSVSYNGQTITVSGKDCKGLLETRIIIPNNTGYTGYSSVPTDSASWTTLRCIQYYVNRCCNPTYADSNRCLPLTVYRNSSSEVRGLMDDHYMARFEYLSDVVTNLCDNADIGYDVKGDFSSNIFELKTLRGTDRSVNQNINPRMIFSADWRNIVSQTFEHSVENVLTSVYGTDSGDYSKLIERNPDVPQQALDMNDSNDTAKIAAGFSRRECNVSVGLSNTDSWFEKYVINEVKDNVAAESFEISVPFSGYGTDYFLGDTVTVKDDFTGDKFTRVITEVTKTYSNGQRAVSLVLGIPKQKPMQKIVNNLINRTQKRK